MGHFDRRFVDGLAVIVGLCSSDLVRHGRRRQPLHGTTAPCTITRQHHTTLCSVGNDLRLLELLARSQSAATYRHSQHPPPGRFEGSVRLLAFLRLPVVDLGQSQIELVGALGNVGGKKKYVKNCERTTMGVSPSRLRVSP